MKDRQRLASAASASVGPWDGFRILHISDLHNRGFWFAREMAAELRPAVVVDTGDLSGLRLLEPLLIRRFYRFDCPLVFAPGNHDSAQTAFLIKANGGEVLDRPRTVEVSGHLVWGYPDPNRTHLLLHRPYDLDVCREASELVVPDPRAHVLAVHNEAMVGERNSAPVVLHGHIHSPFIVERGNTWFVRCGSTGGGGPFGGPLHAAVVDLDGGKVARIVQLVVADGDLTVRRYV